MQEVNTVRATLLLEDPDGSRFARVIRGSYDSVLAGQRTGRYCWSQLGKTEKTHCGTQIEIDLQHEFGFPRGDKMDYRIAGVEVDCKYSQDAKWMIPLEAIGHVLLMITGSDQEGYFSAGLIRATEDIMPQTEGNRDRKRTLHKAAIREHMVWVYERVRLPENILLRLSPETIEAVFAPAHGTQRTEQLFRLVQGRLISRTVVATVARQKDYMRRTRDNGGARSSLQPEGILVLGEYKAHGQIAASLGLPVPGEGEFVSVRVAPRRDWHGQAPFALIDGREWVAATSADPPGPAPVLPTTKLPPKNLRAG